MDRFDSLPKWAQMEIKRLARDLNDANDKIKQMSTGDSNITWRRLFEKNGIPRKSTVCFNLSKDEVEISIDESEDALIIRGSGTISVLPRASNSFYVKSAR